MAQKKKKRILRRSKDAEEDESEAPEIEDEVTLGDDSYQDNIDSMNTDSIQVIPNLATMCSLYENFSSAAYSIW